LTKKIFLTPHDVEHCHAVNDAPADHLRRSAAAGFRPYTQQGQGSALWVVEFGYISIVAMII